MNIFKILASGHGSISETNVSAFLGYLLNPYEEHGLKAELLKRILSFFFDSNVHIKNKLFDKNQKIRELSNKSAFDVEVYLEQAFEIKSKGQGNKRIVDIVVVMYEKEQQKNKKSQTVANITKVNVSRKLKHIFLIETKVKAGDKDGKQLKEEYEYTIEVLNDNIKQEEKLLSKKEIIDLLSVIYIAPVQCEKSFDDFKNEKNEVPKCHIYWQDDDVSSNIVAFLKEILSEEAIGNIEAIFDYSKFLIKSFIQFVENDFKSSILEELDGKNAKNIFYDFYKFKHSYENMFSKESWAILNDFNTFINKHPSFSVRYSPSHPLSVFTGNYSNKIFSLSNYGNTLRVEMVYSNHESLKNKQKVIKEEVEKIFPNIKKPENKNNRFIEIRPITDSDTAIKLFEIQYKYLISE